MALRRVMAWVLSASTIGACVDPPGADERDDDAPSATESSTSADALESSSEGTSSAIDELETPGADEHGPRCDVAIGNAPAFILHAQTREAGDDTTPPSACDSDLDGEDVVFAWTAAKDGRYRLSIDALEHRPLVAVWADCDEGPLLACLAADESDAGVVLSLVAGQQIAVLVDDGVPGGSTEYVLQIAELPE